MNTEKEGVPKESKIPDTPETYIVKGLIYFVVGVLGKILCPTRR